MRKRFTWKPSYPSLTTAAWPTNFGEMPRLSRTANCCTGFMRMWTLNSSVASITPRQEKIAWDHKRYYPGAQLIGEWRSEVATRIDVFTAALYHGMCVAEISDFDLSYTLPLSSPWDPVQVATQAWEVEQRRYLSQR